MLRLSGDLPIEDRSKPEKACRSCAHKFNIFAQGSRCYHCGYRYCSNCLKNWAAWPTTIRGGTADSDYTAKHVCSFCVDFLRITAAGVVHLDREEFTREKLLRYVLAYNIVIDPNRELGGTPISKAELILAITALSKDGCCCLPTENERYYRQHSVPNNVPQSQMGFSRGTLVYPVTRSTNMIWGMRDPWTPLANNALNSSPSVTGVESSLANPVGHSTPFRTRNPLWGSSPYRTLPGLLGEAQESGHDLNDTSTPPSFASSSNSTLCVVCQDAEANIAIITCGHMALCKECSDTIMKSTRHCPLCRAAIPTKNHLIRIYKA